MGNIDLTAASVQLNDQARLTAETAATNGGNIILRDVGRLQLGNNSLISTSAGSDRAGGNGGNIIIKCRFHPRPAQQQRHPRQRLQRQWWQCQHHDRRAVWHRRSAAG